MVSLLLWLACAMPAPSALPAPISAEENVLTLPVAIAYGRAHSPLQSMAESNRQAAIARVVQGRAALLPQASAQIQYERTTSNYVLRPGSLPANLMPTVARTKNRSYNFFAAQAQLSQLVYDFGNTWHAYKQSQASRMAQEQNFRVSEQNVDFNLRTAYYAAFAAQGMVAVGKQTLANMQQHLAQIEEGVTAGTQAAIDVFTAESNVGSAKVTLLGYENALVGSKITLNQAMGYEGDVRYTVATPPWPKAPNVALAIDYGWAALRSAGEPGQHRPSAPTDDPLFAAAKPAPSAGEQVDRGECIETACPSPRGNEKTSQKYEDAAATPWQLSPQQEEALCALAMQTRPDLALVMWQRKAQAYKVRSLQGQRLPSIAVQGTFTEQGEELEKLAYNWLAMGTISWQASTGGLLTGQLQEARATLRAMDASLRNIRLTLRAAVQNAVLGLSAGDAARDAASLAKTSADERLRLAEGRYEAGIGNIIELSDAQLAQANAAAQVVQADYQWLAAHAQWQLAIGARDD